jgi:hypothetical protein
MLKSKYLIFGFLLLTASLCVYAQSNYVPPAGNWERRTPQQAKFDPVKLREAVDFAIA